MRNKSKFNKLLQKQQSQAGGRSTFDPSHLGDPKAMQTDWTPANGSNANFRTHKLVKVNSNRLEFRASIGLKLLLFVVIFFGIGGVIFGYYEGFSVRMIATMSTGLLFVIAGIYGLYLYTTPIVFDKRSGFFWKGRKAPDKVSDRKVLKHFAELEEIHALQLISEYDEEKKENYNYELNLVLKNGNRIIVVDHGDEDKLRKDAHTLSAFMEKPVWDAI